MVTAPFYCKDMAILPESMRTSAAYLGGGIARQLERRGSQLAGVGEEFAGARNKGPIIPKVGQFLQSLGQPVQAFGANVGTKGNIGKRDLGLIAQTAGLGGAFVGGMGTMAGMNALASYLAQDTFNRRANVGAFGSSAMPPDLQAGYVSLNQLGSPLGVMNVAHTGHVKSAQNNQRAFQNAGLAALALGAGGAGVLAGQQFAKNMKAPAIQMR